MSFWDQVTSEKSRIISAFLIFIFWRSLWVILDIIVASSLQINLIILIACLILIIKNDAFEKLYD